MGQSYSVTAVLQAIDKNFSSTYQKAEAQAKSPRKTNRKRWWAFPTV